MMPRGMEQKGPDCPSAESGEMKTSEMKTENQTIEGIHDDPLTPTPTLVALA
jgi:hypothetical protein